MIPVYSHGALWHEDLTTLGRSLSTTHGPASLALGGVIGFSVQPPFFSGSRHPKAVLETTFSETFLPGPARCSKGSPSAPTSSGWIRTLPLLRNVGEVVTTAHRDVRPDTTTRTDRGTPGHCCAGGGVQRLRLDRGRASKSPRSASPKWQPHAEPKIQYVDRRSSDKGCFRRQPAS